MKRTTLLDENPKKSAEIARRPKPLPRKDRTSKQINFESAKVLAQAIEDFRILQGKVNSSVNIIRETVDRLCRRVDMVEKRQEKHVKAFTQRCDALSKTVAEWEENFYYIFHNIKKNQFLYAHYPEEWVTDFLALKEGVKKENTFMNKKISEIDVRVEKEMR